jgi:hypothetical protein
MKHLLVAVLLVVLLCGCAMNGAKVVEGKDLMVGLKIPSADGTVRFDVLNYLSGFRLGVASNSRLTMKYTCIETNSYLYGTITTQSHKDIDATVEPCEDGKSSPDEKSSVEK